MIWHLQGEKKKKQVSLTSHCSARKNENHFSPFWLSNISFVLFSQQEGRSYRLNNNIWHIEKYFCRTRLFDPILVTVCEKAMQHKVFTALSEEEPHNDTFTWHQTWFISNDPKNIHFSLSTFIVRNHWKYHKLPHKHLLILAVSSPQTVFSQSWAVSPYTFASFKALFFYLHHVFDGSKMCIHVLGFFWSLIAEWVKNKYSAVQGCRMIHDSMSFSLALAFPAS